PLPGPSLIDAVKDVLPDWVRQRLFRVQIKESIEEQMVAVFTRLQEIRENFPKVHQDVLLQLRMYAHMYDQESTKFHGLSPVAIVRAVLDALDDDAKANRVVVLLNNVIHRNVLKAGETVAGLARKLTTDPALWPELIDRHRDGLEIEGRKPYILVVDDRPGEISGLVSKLRSAGYDVGVAENGLAGLAALKMGQRPDLIITDVTMPEMDGIAFTRILNQSYADIPVIVRSSDLGNQEYFPTMLSGFVRAAFANVVGVPGKRTDGTKTTNLVKVYLTQAKETADGLPTVDLGDEAMLVRYEKDLNHVNVLSPVAVMPGDSVGGHGPKILRAAQQRGLKVLEVKHPQSQYAKGSHLIYHEKGLTDILGQQVYSDVLKRAGVPTHPPLFVRFLAEGRDRDVLNRDAAYIIKQIFGSQLPPGTLHIRLTGELGDLAGALDKPYIIAKSIGALTEEMKLAIFHTKMAFARASLGRGTSEDDALDLDRQVRKLEELRARLFTPEGAFDFNRNQVLVNGRSRT
ncbi:MAG: response regulator, partial [Candidatus Omnitrophica bacterium]|nr:response regulator [Candidatus Omnitrophota bacterium]